MQDFREWWQIYSFCNGGNCRKVKQQQKEEEDLFTILPFFKKTLKNNTKYVHGVWRHVEVAIIALLFHQTTMHYTK